MVDNDAFLLLKYTCIYCLKKLIKLDSAYLYKQ